MDLQRQALLVYRCFNDDCATTTWIVRQSEENPDLWHIASGADDRPWLVAAVSPVCPHCATTLQPVLARQASSIPAFNLADTSRR